MKEGCFKDADKAMDGDTIGNERTIDNVRTIGNERTIPTHAGSALGRIDQYELLKELGGGGFGTVYLARDTVAGIDVAVKGLPPMIRNNAEELERIRENFALISRLHHPYIAAALVLHPAREVTYSDPSVRQKLRVDSGDTLMVMEYAPGVTLSRWRKQFPGGKVPLEPAIQIAWQIAQALDFAHEQHILHRDVKPSNIMVETKPDGEVVARLLDFGLAAEIRSSMGRVSREIHDTSGTRPYMAPEQWAGRKQGPATDQYALAVLLYEMLTGEVPFASAFETGDPMVMMNAVCNREVEFLEDCPRKMALRRALAKEPSHRFASCTEFIETAAKSEHAPKGEIEASRGDLHGSTEKQRRRGVMTALCIAAVAIGLVSIGGWWWLSGRATRSTDATRVSPVAEVKAEREREEAAAKVKAEQKKREREVAEVSAKAERDREEAAVKAKAEQEKREREEAKSKAKAERERILFEASHKGIQLWEGGPYWAETNVGAEKPEDYGYYFWWGDTVGYKSKGNRWEASNGSRSGFSFHEGNTPTYDKGKEILRKEGWITAEGVLAPKHDAAHVQWGGRWRMPTEQELEDLNIKCDWKWTTVNGVEGYKVRGKGTYVSSTIFLPCAGYGFGASLNYSGSYGCYWSGSYGCYRLSVSDSDNESSWYLSFDSGYHSAYYDDRRDNGFTVRPVQGGTK